MKNFKYNSNSKSFLRRFEPRVAMPGLVLEVFVNDFACFVAWSKVRIWGEQLGSPFILKLLLLL